MAIAIRNDPFDANDGAPAPDGRGRVFRRPVDLSGRRMEDLDLTGATFLRGFAARGATFSGVTLLRDAVFEGGVDLAGAVFTNDARLERSVFRRDASFTGMECWGIACFDHARFEGAAQLDRVVVLANLSLEATVFEKTVSLRATECMGGLWGERTSFPRNTDLTGLEVHGRTWVREATLEGRTPRQIAEAIRSFGYSWISRDPALHPDLVVL